MKFKDVPQDEQFVLPHAVTIAAGVMFQKQYTNTAILIEDFNIDPEEEVVLIRDYVDPNTNTGTKETSEP